MNRKKALTINLQDAEKFNTEQLRAFTKLIFSGDIEIVYVEGTVRGYVKPGVDMIDLLMTTALEVEKNFPVIYELLDPESTAPGVITLDNSGKYCRVTDIGWLMHSTKSNLVLEIPEEETKVTEKFIDGLSTKTALVAWLKDRGLDKEIDTDLLKADLFEAVKKHFGIGD